MGSHYRGTREEIRALNAYINLGRAFRSVDSEVNAHLADYGLTEPQFAVLEVLYHLGPLNQKEISQKILCTPGNLTGVLRKLEKEQLISRCERAQDKRHLEVSLSSAGKRLVEKILPRHVAGVVARFSHLSAAEQESLRILCRKLGRRE